MDVKRDNRLLQAAVPFLFSVGLQNVVDNAIYGALRKEQQLYPYQRIIVKGVDGSFFIHFMLIVSANHSKQNGMDLRFLLF